jgi:hypothetical protein
VFKTRITDNSGAYVVMVVESVNRGIITAVEGIDTELVYQRY